jgi:O-antigen/teichoic acid export membrane protein
MRPGKTTIVDFASNLVVSLAGFVATFAIAVLLGPAALGEYAVATALGFFWLVVPGNAVAKALTKRVSEGDDPGAYFTTGFALNVLIGLALSIAVYASGVLLPLAFATDGTAFVDILTRYTEPIAILVFGTYVYRSVSAGLQGEKRVATAGLLKSFERIGRTLVQVAAILLGYGVSALILGHALALVITAVIGLYLIGLRPTRPEASHVRQIAAFAKYAWMGALRSRVFGWMDTIILAFFVSSTLIGIYEAAWGIASLLAAVSASIQRTLFPEMSDLGTDAAYDRVKHFLDEGLVFAGVFVIPGLLGAGVIGTRVLEFYRPEFSQGAGILLLLVLAYWFDVYASQFLNVINAIDHPDVAFRVNYSFIAANLVLNVVLIWWIGWYGAAIATAVSSALRLGLGYVALRDLVGRLRVPIREISLELAAALVMAGVVFAAKPYALQGRVGTLLLVGLGAGIYSLLLLALSTRIRDKALSLLPAQAV